EKSSSHWTKQEYRATTSMGVGEQDSACSPTVTTTIPPTNPPLVGGNSTHPSAMLCASMKWYAHTGGVMALATWWRGDAAPSLSLLAGFRVEASRDEQLIAQLNRLALDEVRQRLHTG